MSGSNHSCLVLHFSVFGTSWSQSGLELAVLWKLGFSQNYKFKKQQIKERSNLLNKKRPMQTLDVTCDAHFPPDQFSKTQILTPVLAFRLGKLDIAPKPTCRNRERCTNCVKVSRMFAVMKPIRVDRSPRRMLQRRVCSQTRTEINVQSIENTRQTNYLSPPHI